MNTQQEKNKTAPVGTGPGSSGEENADMDRDLTADAETDKSAEAPGNDPAKKEGTNLQERSTEPQSAPPGR
jgi:hypothetical protein